MYLIPDRSTRALYSHLVYNFFDNPYNSYNSFEIIGSLVSFKFCSPPASLVQEDEMRWRLW